MRCMFQNHTLQLSSLLLSSSLENCPPTTQILSSLPVNKLNSDGSSLHSPFRSSFIQHKTPFSIFYAMNLHVATLLLLAASAVELSTASSFAKDVEGSVASKTKTFRLLASDETVDGS